MARVTVKEIPPALPVKEYILTLNESEADALVCLNWFIGGDPAKSPRGLIDGALSALADALGKMSPRTEAYRSVTAPKNGNKIIFDNYRYNE